MPGKPVTTRHVQGADVDAQLQRLGGDDRVQLVGEEAALDVAALLRRVAGAVRLHALGGAARVAVLEPSAHVPVHELRGLARGREGDHAGAGEHALGGHVGRLRQRAPAFAARGVDERRVPEDHGAFRARRLVLVDGRERQADELLGEGLRIGDGRGGEDELRSAAVVVAQASQAAHDLGHVRAEHAAVHVRLVEHDVAQVVQVLGPALVVRQDAHVQHVGVAQQDGGRAPQQGARLRRRVAVVDGRHGRR